MAFVLWVLDGFEEIGIAPGAAAVFRRAASADLDQARVEHPGLGIGEAFDRNRLLPAIAEVVDVSQRVRADVFELVEAGLAGVEEVASPMDAGKGGAPSDVTGAKLVEMAVGAPTQSVTRPAAWQRPRPDAGIVFGGEVSL